MGAGAWDSTTSRGEESEGEDLCDRQEVGLWGELSCKAGDETGGLDLEERRAWRRSSGSVSPTCSAGVISGSPGGIFNSH